MPRKSVEKKLRLVFGNPEPTPEPPAPEVDVFADYVPLPEPPSGEPVEGDVYDL